MPLLVTLQLLEQKFSIYMVMARSTLLLNPQSTANL